MIGSPLRWIAVSACITITGVSIHGWTAGSGEESAAQSTPETRVTSVRPGVPTKLRLPSLGVEAPVTQIGTNRSNTLVPPSDYTTVGWWGSGRRPGAQHGTAILAGHTVATGGGALDDLEHLQAGDQVIVERSGKPLSYVVASVQTYLKSELAHRAGRLFAQSGPSRVAIVTCEDWNGETYLSNVVVIATDPRPISD